MNIQVWPFSVEQLWKGSILASIAHAIAVSRWPDVSNQQSWDGLNYSVQDGMGSKGTICFDFTQQQFPAKCAGAVFGARSNRSKLEKGLPQESQGFLTGIPDDIRSLAEESFQYLLDDFSGEVRPWVTAALWSIGPSLASQDSWEDFKEQGGHLIERQLIPVDTAVTAWKQEYKMSDEESEMLVSLYSRRINNPQVVLTLTLDDRRIIEQHGEGVEESWESFSELSFQFPSIE